MLHRWFLHSKSRSLWSRCSALHSWGRGYPYTKASHSAWIHFLAELVAILVVLEHLIIISSRIKSLRLFSDSQTALGIITLNWDYKNYAEVVRRIKDCIQQLECDGWTVSMFWTPGHADVQGNEVADRLAKDAAKEAQSLIRTPVLSQTKT